MERLYAITGLDWTTKLHLELEVLHYNNILVLIRSLSYVCMRDKISMLNAFVISNPVAYPLYVAIYYYTVYVVSVLYNLGI